MTREQAQEHFLFLVEALAEGGALRFLEERDEPLELGGGGKYSSFPCIDTDEDRLQEANDGRDQDDDIYPDDPIDIRRIQGGRYYVALPRSPTGSAMSLSAPSVASRTGGASPPAMTSARRTTWPPSPSLPSSSSGYGSSTLGLRLGEAPWSPLCSDRPRRRMTAPPSSFGNASI